nr:hypothetical protein [Tanacetum cinerariifolium]
MHPNRGGRIKAIDTDEDITLVDMETKVDLDVELQGRIERKDDDNTAIKEASAVEPTVFDDEEVTMTIAQTLIKMKAKKARLLDELMAKKLHDEKVKQAASREKQEKDDFEKAKPDRDEEPTKKKVAEESLLQESFKKLRAEVKVSGSEYTQDTPIIDPKEMSEEDVQNMLQIVPVSKFKVEALQVKLVKQKFSTVVPTINKEKALWVELKSLFELDTDDVLWKLQRERLSLVKWSHDPDVEYKVAS